MVSVGVSQGSVGCVYFCCAGLWIVVNHRELVCRGGLGARMDRLFSSVSNM